MALDFNIMLLLISLVLGTISLFIGIKLAIRCAGNLRYTIISLSIALIILMIYQTNSALKVVNANVLTGNVIGTSLLLNSNINLEHTIVIFLIFLSSVEFNRMIKKIDTKK